MVKMKKKLIVSGLVLLSVIFFYQLGSGQLEKYKPAPEEKQKTSLIQKNMIDYKNALAENKNKAVKDLLAGLSMDNKLRVKISSLKDLDKRALQLQRCLDDNLKNKALNDQKLIDISLSCIINFDWLKK